MIETFDVFTHRVRADVHRRLSQILETHPEAPSRLLEALRYAALGSGKRIRPLLVIASGEACTLDPLRTTDNLSGRLLTAACALELIHTFSLIHDDLPALDNDDLRRGRPTLHVRFDEATAVLAGDALLNLAYEVLSSDLDGDGGTKAIAVISGAVGLGGMIAGQVLDLQYEGTAVDGAILQQIHTLKTGALIRASCEIGAIVTCANPEMTYHMREYGRHVGLAFQIVDDILDVEGSTHDLGKSPGKDARASKATFPSMWGLEESRRRAAESVQKACDALTPLASRAKHLLAIAEAVLTRKR